MESVYYVAFNDGTALTVYQDQSATIEGSHKGYANGLWQIARKDITRRALWLVYLQALVDNIRSKHPEVITELNPEKYPITLKSSL